MPLFGPPDVEKLKAKRDVKGLVKALYYRKDPSIQQSAADALDEVGWQPDNSDAGATYWILRQQWDKCVPIGFSAVKPLIAALHDTKGDEGVINALAEIGEPAVEPLINDLTSLGTLEDSAIRDVIGATLKQIGPSAVDPLIKALLRSGSPLVAEALGKVGAPAVESLIERLGYSVLDNRGYLIEDALGHIGEPAVGPLIAVLKEKETSRDIQGTTDPATVLRRRAARALGLTRDKRAVQPLLDALTEEEPADSKRATRDGIVWALGHIGDDRAVEPLVNVLVETEHPASHAFAVVALAKIGEPAVQPLIALLESKEDRLRAGSISALAQIGMPAVDLLVAAIREDESFDIHQVAKSVLAQIGKSGVATLISAV